MGKATIRQTQIFHDYYSRLKCIALNLFKWHNLPESCNERYLENCLFEYGTAVFVDDPEFSFLTLKGASSGTVNIYNEPIEFTVTGSGLYGSKVFGADRCVLIRNNHLEKSTDSTVAIFAERLTKIQLAMDVNINAQKTPILIRCDKQTETSLRALYNQYEEDRPRIFGNRSLSEKPLEVLQTGAPFVADKLREEKCAVWNEVFEFFGINTNPSDKKKERVFSAEINSNNEQIDMQSICMQISREMACEEINKKFGLSVSVEKQVDKLREMFNADMGGVDGGEIHD